MYVSIQGGEVSRVKWKLGVTSLPDFFNKLFRDIIPVRIVFGHGNIIFLDVKPNSSTCGGRKLKHPYIFHWSGHCMGKFNGCYTTFSGGVDLEKLKVLGIGKMSMIKLSILFCNNCVHIKDMDYESLRGSSREREIIKVGLLKI